jgi:hypothetical protein
VASCLVCGPLSYKAGSDYAPPRVLPCASEHPGGTPLGLTSLAGFPRAPLLLKSFARALLLKHRHPENSDGHQCKQRDVDHGQPEPKGHGTPQTLPKEADAIDPLRFVVSVACAASSPLASRVFDLHPAEAPARLVAARRPLRHDTLKPKRQACRNMASPSSPSMCSL